MIEEWWSGGVASGKVAKWWSMGVMEYWNFFNF
jgi:hypothetical protein